MPKLREVARHVRSKVAGPFWVTIDIFFPDSDAFDRWHDNAAIGASAIAGVYGLREDDIAIHPVPSLSMVKIAYPRAQAQGGMLERDLHSGQQYVYLLDVDMVN